MHLYAWLICNKHKKNESSDFFSSFVHSKYYLIEKNAVWIISNSNRILQHIVKSKILFFIIKFYSFLKDITSFAELKYIQSSIQRRDVKLRT